MPAVIRIAEIGLVLVGVVIVFTQIILPALLGGRFFPGFRGSKREQARVADAQTRERLDHLDERVAAHNEFEGRISSIEQKLNPSVPEGAEPTAEETGEEDDTSSHH